MAGTRLLIQATALVQFVILLVSAIYFGLCEEEDVLCVALLRPNVGSDLQLPPQHERISLPIISVVVHTNERYYDKDDSTMMNSNRNNNITSSSFQVVQSSLSDKILDAFCQGEYDQDVIKKHHIWICPPRGGGGDRNDMIAQITIDSSSGSAIVFPVDGVHLVDIHNVLFQGMQLMKERKRASITLVLEDETSWEQWSLALQNALDPSVVPWKNLPCLTNNIRPESTLLIQQDWSSKASKRKQRHHQQQSSKGGVSEVDDTAFGNEILKNDALDILKRFESLGTSEFDITIAVPLKKNMPLFIRETSAPRKDASYSTALATTEKVLSFVNKIPSPPMDDDQTQQGTFDTTIREALSFAVPFFQKKCFGDISDRIVRTSKKNPSSNNDAGVIPSWQILLSTQRLLMNERERARVGLEESRHCIEKAANAGVVVQSKIIENWQLASEMYEKALEYAKHEKYQQSLEYLEQSIRTTNAIKMNDALIEPTGLSHEHNLAIFAPMLFPLLTALLGGVVREVKRYRLKIKKND